MKRIIILVIATLITVVMTSHALDNASFYSSPTKQSLEEYLKEIRDWGQHLNLDNANQTILDLRNGLDNIYYSWELCLKATVEKEILNKIYFVGRNHPDSYVRMECTMILGIIGNRDSLPFLQEMLKDEDELVRKYVAKSVKTIKMIPTKHSTLR